MMRRDLPGSVLLCVVMTACGPGGAGKPDVKVEGKGRTTADAEVDAKVDAPPDTKKEPVVGQPTERPLAIADAVRPAVTELDGRAIETTTVDGWERRAPTGGGGGGPRGALYDGAPAPSGAAPASEGASRPRPAEYGLERAAKVGAGGGGKTAIAGLDDGFKGGSPGAPASKPVQAAGPLKAGATDDNADYKGFLAFLDTWTGRADVADNFQPLDVRDRQFIQVLDSDGRPIPGAQINVSDASSGRELWRARTYGDGRAPFYPRLWGAQVQTSGRYSVVVAAEGESLTTTWDGASELVLRTVGSRKDRPMVLEVLFLIDTTGSMGDEIAQVKSTLLAVTSKVKAVREDLDLRYGAVLYRDLFDDYVTMAYPFTADVQKFDEALRSVQAAGGGDLPEAMNQGLDRAISGMPWQGDAAKVVFLIADAPPQMRQRGDVLYGDSAVRAVGQGIRLHSVAASGLDELGTLVLRQLAQLTRGKFIFIEYGSTQESAAKHGVSGPVQSNNLDDILVREITAEIEGWGRP